MHRRASLSLVACLSDITRLCECFLQSWALYSSQRRIRLSELRRTPWRPFAEGISPKSGPGNLKRPHFSLPFVFVMTEASTAVEELTPSTSQPSSPSEEEKIPSPPNDGKDRRKRHCQECHRTADHEEYYHKNGKRVEHAVACPKICMEVNCEYSDGHYVRNGLQKTGAEGKRIRSLSDEERDALVSRSRKRPLEEEEEENKPKKIKIDKEEKKRQEAASKKELIITNFKQMITKSRDFSKPEQQILIDDGPTQFITSVVDGDQQQKHATTMVNAAVAVKKSFTEAPVGKESTQIIADLEDAKMLCQRALLTLENVLHALARNK